MPLSNEQWRDLILSVGTGRGSRRLSPPQVSRLLQEARSYLTRDEIATRLSLKGTDMVSRFLSLANLSDDDLRLVCWRKGEGFVPFTSAYFISKLQNSADRSALMRASISNAIDTTEVESIVQIIHRSGLTLSEAVSRVTSGRRQVVTHHLLAGLLDHLPPALRGLDEKQQSAFLRRAVLHGVPGMSVLGARISGDKYYIVTDSEGAKAMREGWEKKDLDMDSFVAGLLRST